MNKIEYKKLVKQKNQILDKTISVREKIENTRLQIARPYVLALKKQFPNKNKYELIEIADMDLQKSNQNYKRLTESLIELQEFNQEASQKLDGLIKQTLS